MTALPWQDHLYIILGALAFTGSIAGIIWIKIGTLEEEEVMPDSPRWNAQGRSASPESVPRPGSDAVLAGPGHPSAWAKPTGWAEPSEEDTLTWLAEVHETPGRALDETPDCGPARPGSDRLDELAAAFAADTIVDAQMRDWLDELIEKGLDGYRSADEWVAARMRELAAV
jgi:hypothetical protein